MKKYWETAEGDLISYKKLSDSHLINILNKIERWAEKGITVLYGGGIDAEDIWYDEEYINGEEVKKRYDYKGLLKEAEKRGLGKNKYENCY